MAGPYSRFGNDSQDYFRQLITGGDIEVQPEESPGIMSRSRFSGSRPPVANDTPPEQPEEPYTSFFENFARMLGRSSDDPERVADAVLRDSQPVRPTGGLDGWEEMPSVDTIIAPRPDQTRAALGSASPQTFDLAATIESRLVELEGFKSQAYKPVESEEHYTIGYGHYSPNVTQGQSISEREARELLRQDIQERLPQIRRAFPEYNNFSPELQVELAQGWFRGDVSGSPNTRRLINEGRFEEAAVEFLNNEEYRRAEALGKPGIRPRMEAVAAAIREEGSRRSGTQANAPTESLRPQPRPIVNVSQEQVQQAETPTAVTSVIAENMPSEARVNPAQYIFDQGYIGLNENNSQHQATIQGFLNNAVAGFAATPSEVTQNSRAWCAAFVDDVLTNLGAPRADEFEAIGGAGNYQRLRAREYLNYGSAVDGVSDAQPGDIVVIQNTGGGYHVGFFTGMDSQGRALILGGNQSNAVNVTPYSTARIRGVRRIENVAELDTNTLKEITTGFTLGPANGSTR